MRLYQVYVCYLDIFALSDNIVTTRISIWIQFFFGCEKHRGSHSLKSNIWVISSYVIYRDNVVWDEDQEKEAQEKVNKNSQNKVSVTLQGNIMSWIYNLLAPFLVVTFILVKERSFLWVINDCIYNKCFMKMSTEI